ncbi:MAG: DUF1566 domain-containing protein [Candidatus Aegiribacteria sp.]|nr:DUF1566 domain-containing protein [Candidatus Aegiribacteria sp.]MBD3294150.1 DUF1566 domain-containing protein [Candidatus Fermentibacteria bacterium]
MLWSLVHILPIPVAAADYQLPDTNQSLCFDTVSVITEPEPGAPFYGQDAQYQGLQPSYADNGDGTVTDLNTGLMWVQGLPPDKMTWEEAMAGADTCQVGGYTDWRLPTIKELYSLIMFSGTDPSGPFATDPVPFIDTDYFQFSYGDTLSGERLIDAQYWSSTVYKGLTFMGDSTAFGVNFADGRIKGYPSQEVGPPGRRFMMTSFVRYVRGGNICQNQFVDNGDGTVTDLATGLMWQQADDGTGRNWQEALDYAEDLELAGYDDWRLPDAHQLQSVVDYERSLQYTGSPAIDPVFHCTEITDQAGEPNYGFYWTSTTHKGTEPASEGTYAVYIAFGEALGWQQTPDSCWVLLDVHGAGAQRSDPKCGDPEDWPHGHGPQGDVIRIYNLVRCVREANTGVQTETSSQDPWLELEGSSPASGTVTLNYGLETPGECSITVHDVTGRRMATLLSGHVPAGSGTAIWNTHAQPSGLYLCIMKTEYSSICTRVSLI